jgi:DNA-nicking Smr family endonuclease
MSHRKIKYRLRSKSFAELKELLQRRAISLPDHRLNSIPYTNDDMEGATPVDEEGLLSEAMKGVVPIDHGDYVDRILPVEVTTSYSDDTRDDAAAMARLSDLVKYGKGFIIADTPEYIEGTGYDIHPSVARRLHQGSYSIQGYVDLHGLLVDDAQEAFEKFLRWAITAGKTGVLIVHGRGLSSPDEPVLKKKVIEWLTRGRWRKWVVAYASARACDGGAGATYVLLGRRPLAKKVRKAKNR